jgi:branched-chain amino acid transport system substrate-binding protein
MVFRIVQSARLRQGAALLSTVAVLTAACGPAATPSPTAPTAATSGAVASTGPARGEPIKVGYVWGVTGAAAEIVRPASEATRAYFDDFNQHGGVNGRPVEMVEIDSKYQVPLAQEGYKKVTTDDKVPLVVLASTGDTEALAAQINGDKVAAITFSCDEKWAQPSKNPYVFTICTTYQDQMATALKFVKEAGKGTNVAFSYPDIPFGQAPLAVGRDYAGKLGLKLVDEQKVGAGDVDAQSQALNLKSTNPNWVLIQNITGGTSAMVRSGKQLGLGAQFLGLNYAFDEATIKAIGPQAAEGYIGVGPNAFPGPEVGILQDMHQRAPKLTNITMRSIVGWTLASVVADALKRADGYTGTAILKALEKTDLDVKGAIPGSRWTSCSKSKPSCRGSRRSSTTTRRVCVTITSHF